MIRTDDGGLYNPDNYGCRKRAAFLLLVPLALIVGLCSLGGCLL